MNNPGENILKWRFDVSTFRLIGHELITDRITALFELVKNCYDANSTRVDIIFENVSFINPNSKITIKDNGYGMKFEDIRDKWMVIGTSSKRKEPYSPEPFKRRCVGEKGIGRFAVDKLGYKVNIITKTRGASHKLNVEIDWNKYETSFQRPEEQNEHVLFFTDIENKCQYEAANKDEQGTTLSISGIREGWTVKDIDRLYKELTKLVSPFYPLKQPFDIYISSNEYNHLWKN